VVAAEKNQGNYESRLSWPGEFKSNAEMLEALGFTKCEGPKCLSDEEWGITPEIRENGMTPMSDEDRKFIHDAIKKMITDYLDLFWKRHDEIL
jgi:hypothetical protein